MPDALAAALAPLAEAAEDPDAYVVDWKRRTGRRAVGIFPMHFPAEIAHAAGALPVLIQESPEPDVHGRNLLAEFYCGYTRGLADAAARGNLDIYDGFFLADHCIQLLGAVDVVRSEQSSKPMFFGQLPTSLTDSWTLDQARTMMQSFVDELGGFAGAPLTDDALRSSIALFNTNRGLLREIFAARRDGNAALTSGEMQVLVKSSMVMDRAEHTELLRRIVAELPYISRDERIRVHLSGHLCHAPKPELLAAIEECGAVVVDDDLFTGTRYVAADVSQDGEPVEALAQRYLRGDAKDPNPTRVKHETDWEDQLVRKVEAAGAQGVIVLMVRFCEPHMLYYPELRRRLDQHDIPHLLIETEHEGLPVETVQTRVEAFLERIRRNRAVEVHA